MILFYLKRISGMKPSNWRRVEPGVVAVLFQQLRMGALFNDTVVGENDNA